MLSESSMLRVAATERHILTCADIHKRQASRQAREETHLPNAIESGT